MKLLYVLGSYYPAQSGGPNNTIHWQAKYLSKGTFDVSVASLKSGLTQDNINEYKIDLNSKNIVEGVKVYYFDYFLNRYFSFKFYIWLMCNIYKFDFVQLTSYFFPITWFSILICNITNTPFSIAPRGELEDNAITFSRSIKMTVHHLFLKFLYRKARFILITSYQELEFSKKYFDRKMIFELVPNYIDLSKSIPLQESEILSKQNILYLGRLHPKKGLSNLIKAYFSLPEAIIKSHLLLIAGTGDPLYIDSLKALVRDSEYSERVIFLNHMQGAEKERIYKKSKVFVLPSYSENFGNVVLEALSFSIPVITSKHTPWETLNGSKCGFWIENTPDQIVTYLEKVLSMETEEYVGYSKKAYRFVYDNYDIAQNISLIEKTYGKYAN